MLSVNPPGTYRAVACDVTILRNPLPCGKIMDNIYATHGLETTP